MTIDRSRLVEMIIVPHLLAHSGHSSIRRVKSLLAVSGPAVYRSLLPIRVTRHIQYALPLTNFSLIAQSGSHRQCLGYLAFATTRLLCMLLIVQGLSSVSGKFMRFRCSFETVGSAGEQLKVKQFHNTAYLLTLAVLL